MPTTYTHDAFGKEVFKRLPTKIKETIRGGKTLYRIGQHGPDIFFYYRPFIKNKVNSLGYEMHQDIAAPFFREAVEEFKKSPSKQLAAYLLGFACHYVLDSTCHGYIGEYEKAVGASHAEIETELDRSLMTRDGKKLHEYCPAGVLQPDQASCRVIAEVFPQIGEKLVRKSITSMKFYDRLLTCRSKTKEKVILNGMKVLGCYDSMQGQIMRRKPLENCRESTKILLDLYNSALEEAPGVLENLYDCLYGHGTLSDRFDRNFE